MQLGVGARCRGQRLGEGGTIRRKTGTNSGLARLELWHSVPEMVLSPSKPEQILSHPEPS